MNEIDFKRIVKEGVNEVFELHGFNVSEPTQTQGDMQYLRAMRKGCDAVKMNVLKVIVTTTIPTGIYLVWLVVKNALKETVVK